MKKAIICQIEHYAIHDGPGIRTVVFFKGCPLRCLWCSNPETQNNSNELLYNKSKCILCGRCVKSCNEGALEIDNGTLKVAREKCIKCNKCVENCVMGAVKLAGSEMTVDEVFLEIEKDAVFYSKSNGGVTLSGGEVLMNHEFAIELLKKCKDSYISTAIETTGFGDIEILKDFCKYTDLFLYDIKHINPSVHKQLTGVDNKHIINNLKGLSNIAKNIIIRVPLIPGLNDDTENIRNTINLAKSNCIREIHILPYHSLGVDKYRQLQKDYALRDLKKQNDNYIDNVKNIIEANGLKCVIGG